MFNRALGMVRSSCTLCRRKEKTVVNGKPGIRLLEHERMLIDAILIGTLYITLLRIIGEEVKRLIEAFLF